jgi:asparagine synthase (glutamine-hydrolysing)
MTDATFMHSGVEVRLPYLHHPLQAYVRSLPGQVRMQHGSKWVLKNMLRQYDLDAIATRPKEGFGMPLAQWLGDKEHHHLFDVLARKECFVHDFLPHNMLKDWIKEVKAGKARHVQELWSVLLFEHWARQMF